MIDLQAEPYAHNLTAIDLAPEGTLLTHYYVVRENVLRNEVRQDLTLQELRHIIDLCRQVGAQRCE